MDAEVVDVVARARVHAALGDVVRLSIVDRLVVSDASPGELGRLLDLPTNLVAHHIRVLEDVGLVTRTRSEGDRRRSYLRLVPERLTHSVVPGIVAGARVVFVCTHNSARSQFAAAMWGERSSVPAASGGTEPADRVHPRAVRCGRRHGLDLSRVRPVSVEGVVRPGDLVISVCDQAHEQLPTGGTRLHWSVPDPARVDTDRAFEDAYAEISRRVDQLLPLVDGSRS